MLLSLNNLFQKSVTNEKKTFLLKNINLKIQQGEFVIISGNKGSGKSTLLSIIGFLFIHEKPLDVLFRSEVIF